MKALKRDRANASAGVCFTRRKSWGWGKVPGRGER